jgi:tetratricopeptide (TPR) repeat protein
MKKSILLIVALCFMATLPAATGNADENAKYYFKSGMKWYKKGQYDQSIENFNRAIEIDPEYSMAYASRGLVWVKTGKYDRAIEDYNTAIEINPELDRAYIRRGMAWTKMKKYDRAIEDFSKAMEISPRRAGAYNSLAWLLATCPDAKYRDGKRAIQIATKAVELSGSAAVMMSTLAAAYAEQKQFKKAVKTQNKVIMKLMELGDERNMPEMKRRLKMYKGKKGYSKN